MNARLFLGVLEEEAEAFVFSDPGGQLASALLPRRLQLGLQLAQHVQLLIQARLAGAGHLQVQLQVQRGAQQAVQTFHRQGRLGGGT